MESIVKGTFDDALKALKSEKQLMGIGTYMEKTLHIFLKNYFEPDTQFHEMPLGRKCADISNEHGVIEIQTRSLNNLRSKLDSFLPEHTVTVVYPYAALKWLCWLDPETGEITKKRKSPRKLTRYDAFYELYKIKQYLSHPNFNLYLIGLELEETRLLDGWSNDKKSGSTRFDRFPVSVIETVHIKSIDEYLWLLPDGLPEFFTSADYAKGAGVTPKIANYALNCLCCVGVIEKVGTKGRRNLYKIV